MDYLEIQKKLEPIVRNCAEVLMKYYRRGVSVEFKGDVDLITEADRAAEERIVGLLKEDFPEHGILAEEGHEFEGTSGFRWIIDPLDGTTNFAHNFPLFAVSVALCDEENRPVVAGVYNPVFNEYFSAISGGGAKLNKNSIWTSQVKELDLALLGTGFPYNRREIMDSLMSRLAKVLYRVQDVRRTGSAAIDICYVACGRTDGYFEQGLKPWDTAAAWLILTEAGGKMSRFNNFPFDPFIPETLASNGKIHDLLISLLKGSF